MKSGWVSGQEGLDACLFHSFVGLWLSSIRSPRSSAFITYSLHLTAEGERIREIALPLLSSSILSLTVKVGREGEWVRGSPSIAITS